MQYCKLSINIHCSICRALLVLDFIAYALQRDISICQARYAAANDDWMFKTRLSSLICNVEEGKKQKRKFGSAKNNAILQAVGYVLELWVKVYDSNTCPDGLKRDGIDGCLAALRIAEMLFIFTDQIENVLQKIHSLVCKMKRDTRLQFIQVNRFFHVFLRTCI